MQLFDELTSILADLERLTVRVELRLYNTGMKL